MASKQSGLGKGLKSLMLENSVDDMTATNMLSINEIQRNEDQPRKTFDEGAFRQYYAARCITAASCKASPTGWISACCR